MTLELAQALAIVGSGVSTHSDDEMALMKEANDTVVKAVSDIRVARGIDPPAESERPMEQPQEESAL